MTTDITLPFELWRKIALYHVDDSPLDPDDTKYGNAVLFSLAQCCSILYRVVVPLLWYRIHVRNGRNFLPPAELRPLLRRVVIDHDSAEDLSSYTLMRIITCLPLPTCLHVKKRVDWSDELSDSFRRLAPVLQDLSVIVNENQSSRRQDALGKLALHRFDCTLSSIVQYHPIPAILKGSTMLTITHLSLDCLGLRMTKLGVHDITFPKLQFLCIRRAAKASQFLDLFLRRHENLKGLRLEAAPGDTAVLPQLNIAPMLSYLHIRGYDELTLPPRASLLKNLQFLEEFRYTDISRTAVNSMTALVGGGGAVTKVCLSWRRTPPAWNNRFWTLQLIDNLTTVASDFPNLQTLQVVTHGRFGPLENFKRNHLVEALCRLHYLRVLHWDLETSQPPKTAKNQPRQAAATNDIGETASGKESDSSSIDLVPAVRLDAPATDQLMSDAQREFVFQACRAHSSLERIEWTSKVGRNVWSINREEDGQCSVILQT